MALFLDILLVTRLVVLDLLQNFSICKPRSTEAGQFVAVIEVISTPIEKLLNSDMWICDNLKYGLLKSFNFRSLRDLCNDWLLQQQNI
jgi:hypothetical protein